MTASATYSPQTYTGNGVTDTFPTVFQFDAAADIVVTERVIATGAETVKTLTTHFTVTGGSGSSGNVVAVTPPASTVQWVISRNTTRSQEVDYTANDPFPAETNEGALDKLTRISQEVADSVARSLRFPATDSSALSAIIPNSVERASKFLGFDAAGEPVASAGSVDGLTVSSFGETLIDDADAATARTTLGIASASDTAEGLAEFATDAETATGTATARAVTPAGAAAHYSPITRAINAQTGTTYTLVLADAGKLVTLTNGSAVTMTVPLNSSVAFPVGTQIDLFAGGAGQVTVAATGGVTINSKDNNLALSSQYSPATLVKTATDTWFLVGDLA